MNTIKSYCTICEADRDVPSLLLDGMAQAPDIIARALAAHPSPASDGWSPREVIAHLADSEIGFGWRIRRILTEDDPLIASYDEQAWSQSFFYGERDITVALDAFRATRGSNVEILRRMADATLSRPYRQSDVHRTLGDLLHHRADHDLQHLRQITSG
ncbi:MAG: DinB family protein [Dehalococcoidia bacterium]